MILIIRDHDRGAFEDRKMWLAALVQNFDTGRAAPAQVVIQDQYRNMRTISPGTKIFWTSPTRHTATAESNRLKNRSAAGRMAPSSPRRDFPARMSLPADLIITVSMSASRSIARKSGKCRDRHSEAFRLSYPKFVIRAPAAFGFTIRMKGKRAPCPRP